MQEKLPLNQKYPLNNVPYMYDTDGQRARRHIVLRELILDLYDIAANWLNVHPGQLAKYHSLSKYNVDNGSWGVTRKNPLHTSALFTIAFDLMDPEKLFQLHEGGYSNTKKTLKEKVMNPLTEGPRHAMELPDGNMVEETDVYVVLEDYIYNHPEKFARFQDGFKARHEKAFILPHFITPKYQEEYLAIVSESIHPQLQVNCSSISEVNYEYQPGFFSTRPKEQKSYDWDFAHPSTGMLILAACIPVIGWAYLVYVLFNVITESRCGNDEENFYKHP